MKAPDTKLPIQSPWLAIVNRRAGTARKLAAEPALPPAQRSRAGTAVRDAVSVGDKWSF